MRCLYVIFIIFLISCITMAESPAKYADKYVKRNIYPQGTFKKTGTGKIVQIDENGKKLAVYKISNGKLVKVK